MIIFEACKSLCELKNISNTELAKVISFLALFLNSESTVNKYAALKILNKVLILFINYIF